MTEILLPGRYEQQNHEPWNGVFEKYRITWGARSFTSLHDHGKSEGTILVLSGFVWEIQFGMETKELHLCRKMGPGNVILEMPGRIQMMASEEGALTDHTFHRAPMTMTEFPPEFIHTIHDDIAERLPEFIREYFREARERWWAAQRTQ